MLNTQIAGKLTIPNGGTSSNIVGLETLEDAESFILQAPAVLTEAVTINVSWDGINFAQLMDSAGVAVKCPIVNTAISYRQNTLGPAMFLKLVAGSAVAADRTFVLTKQTRL